MARRRLGRVEAVGPEGMRGFDAQGLLVLVARIDGAWAALDDPCNHAGCMLSWGRREADSVVCTCHGVAFDLATGKNLNAPLVCGDQRAWRVTEADGELWLEEDPDGPRP